MPAGTESQSVRRRKPAQPSSSPNGAATEERLNQQGANGRPTVQAPPADTSFPVAYLAVSMLLACAYCYLALSLPRGGPQNAVRAVVIDAGSTATRAQLFTFTAVPSDKNPAQPNLTLISTEIHEMPGRVAALAFGGVNAVDFFAPLVDKMRLAVHSPSRRAKVPIILRATAGLRLLGSEASEEALKGCRVALHASGFLFDDSWASVLDETDEAVFAWTGVNYLIGALDSASSSTPPRSNVGIMDMGGSSVQFAFRSDAEPEQPARLSEAEVRAGRPQPSAPAVVMAKFLQSTHRVIAKSHLRHGMKDFTALLYTLFDREGVLADGNPCFRSGKHFAQKTVRLGLPGAEEARTIDIVGDGDFGRCVASVEIVLDGYDVPSSSAVKLAKGTTFYAFAYFHDRVVGFGLPESPTLEDFEAKGEQLCSAAMKTDGLGEAESRDEACVEFSYIFAILRRLSNNFDKESGVSFRFVQYVDGHMLGWALGAALKELTPELMSTQLKRNS